MGLLEALRAKYPKMPINELPRLDCYCKGTGEHKLGSSEFPCVCTRDNHWTENLARQGITVAANTSTYPANGISITQLLQVYLRYPAALGKEYRSYSLGWIRFEHQILRGLVNPAILPKAPVVSVNALERNWVLEMIARRFNISPAVVHAHYRSIGL